MKRSAVTHDLDSAMRSLRSNVLLEIPNRPGYDRLKVEMKGSSCRIEAVEEGKDHRDMLISESVGLADVMKSVRSSET